jgi:hypothetical protein
MSYFYGGKMLKSNLFQRLFSSKPAGAKTASEARTPVYHPLPDPDTLLSDTTAVKKYFGRLVDWDLVLENMDGGFDAQSIIVLAKYDGSATSIWLTVPIAENLNVYDYGSGSQINVKGRIQAIRGGIIYLDNCLINR